MSRSAAQRLQQQQLLVQQQQQMAENEAAALAAEMFDLMCGATTMRQVLGLYRNMCDTIGIHSAPLNEFYPKLKTKIRSWKAQALWKKFDARAAHRVYNKGNASTGTRVLVIGAGPCGLRTAIEAQLLGAKVVVVEKRDRISRNNVLHLWPFVITDLRNLGAKKFYGKFCAGSIDHISIRQLQCMLLKVALLLGVEIHEGVSFEDIVEPTEGCGWRAKVSPEDHAVSHYEFDVLIGADGKRNTLEGFKRKEFRGKLAIAITANFINKKTEAEAKAEEISGVAFIFNQSFFKELYQTTGIDLENIVYYKDETHYFVMTAKKHSLIDKGVIMQDFADPAELLAPANVNTDKLLDYAREAANFSTKYQMPNLEFAVNHYGKPDVAMFDFTSMFQAEASCRVTIRKNYRLLQCLVGDSLLEPFWPTGSGCARGFLSSMDAAYAIKLWNNSRNSILGVIAQRESIYRLLAQTTPENLQRDTGAYTVDPATRYPNLNKSTVNVWQVKHLLDTDDLQILEQTFMDTNAIQITPEIPIRRKRRTGDMLPLSAVLLRWIKAQLHSHEFTQKLNEVSDCFTNGKVLCALINRYRPDLVDLNKIKYSSPVEANEIAFNILQKELRIPRVMSAEDSINLEKIDSKIWLNYLEQICELFRGEIPHVKHPKLDVAEFRQKPDNKAQDFSKLLKFNSKKAKSPMNEIDGTNVVNRRSVLDEDKVKRQRNKCAAGSEFGQNDSPRRAKKRRSAEKSTNIEERQQRLKEIEENRQDRQSKRRLQRFQQTQNFYKSLHMLQANTLLRESDENSGAFEDYSIFLYRQQAPIFNDRVKDLEKKLLFPDRERGIPSALPREVDEQFSNRIRNMEQRISSRNAGRSDKKPKDLMRAIGKIDSSDWNVREIEKKIEQSKKTEVGNKGKEKVPKWSKEQFLARQHKMAKPERQESVEEKFKEIDQTLKNLDKQLKEGRNLEVGERGKNKVASIADQFVKKDDTSEEKNLPSLSKTNQSSKVAQAFKKQSASEKCHFCKQTVYLMEKISTEGLVLHRSCLKCHHCHTNLRMGGYAFDRDDPTGKFYCTQHFKLPAKAIRPVVRKSGHKKPTAVDTKNTTGADSFKTPEKPRGRTDNVAQLDLLDRGQTPERIEFENADAMSDGEPSLENIIDENEWTDRNFLSDSQESDSDLSSSDDSDDESESDIFEEANDSPIGVQTLQLANDWIGKQRYSNVNSDDSDGDFYDSSEGFLDGDNEDSQTEGEEFKKAREMRREEVRLLPIPTNLPTDTETEVQSDSDSSSNNDVEHNSATEISTDSEFDLDPIIRETPKLFADDTNLRKPTKVQIKQGVIGNSSTNNHRRYDITTNNNNNGRVFNNNQNALKQNQQSLIKQELEFKPLVQVDPSVLTANRVPLKNPRPGDYLLNKTASTEGIASKKSLELKKRYLLGGESGNGHKIMKSGSTSILDSKFRNFHSNISECQKLLNPTSDISPSIKTFLDRKTTPTITTSNKGCENGADGDKNLTKTIQTNKTLEKDNVFVNNVNKSIKFSETVNLALVETFNKTPNIMQAKKVPSPVIEIIDLVSPEKNLTTIDLTTSIDDQPLINHLKLESSQKLTVNSLHSDDNEIIDLTIESPVKSDKTVIEENSVREIKIDVKPDVSKDLIEAIPDIITHAEEVKVEKMSLSTERAEKVDDSPERCDLKEKDGGELNETSIDVLNIPWIEKKLDEYNGDNHSESITSASSSSSSVGDIQHYILESTTSPDTQTGQIVPRLEVHDSSGTLMQIDSLMIIDGKYIGDPDDLKNMEIPEGLQIPNVPTTKVPEEEPPEVPKEQLLTSKKPELRFDTKNENKIDSLRNLPMIMDRNDTKNKNKPNSLDLNLYPIKLDQFDDKDKTPTAEQLSRGSDSETEMTGQVFTETELSDWTADDAISENFVDTEFVLNSNKGTIKRNKKLKKKSNSSATTVFEPTNVYKEPTPSRSNQKECGILKNLDIDEIEFMDTGSEGSCAEAYSATNMTMLKNRGYIEFIENTPPVNLKPQYARPQQLNTKNTDYQKESSPSHREIAGIDYIEQGACILQNDNDAKTPVNEVSPANNVHHNNTFHPTPLNQSINDSTIDCDDDSLGIITNNSQAATNNANTTTEESEALTVVTSPLDSSSPKTQDQFNLTTTTPSSSDRYDVTSSSNNTAATSSRTTTQKSSMEEPLVSGGSNSSSMRRKESDEMSYEEYVRKLQHKITQISTARDSIDVRKHKRKSSKGEMASGSSCGGNESTISVIETNNKVLSIFDDSTVNKTPPASPKVTLDEINLTTKDLNIHKVPEIPTLSSKLEEITKERTKQKDLIHDLVMDKLQSKKQLNAEKRLNRSRNRSLFSPGGSYQTSTKITSNGDCSNSPHYHVASSERITTTSHDISSKENHPSLTKMISSSKENKDVIGQMFERATPARVVPKQRPISEILDPIEVQDRMFRLSKTQSFSYQKPTPLKEENSHRVEQLFTTPNPPPRMSRNIDDTTTSHSALTDKMRMDARARARLKSNQELGLSPEEKQQLLRKRYHLELQDIVNASMKAAANLEQTDELRARERKMISSKSVNDISGVQLILNSDENFNEKKLRGDDMKTSDFTSDPNLLEGSGGVGVGNKSIKNRRQKDPERRKSLIQAVSNFFSISKKDKDTNSPPKEKSISNMSNISAVAGTSSVDGVFNRFKISAKSREKSKDKEDLPLSLSLTSTSTSTQPPYVHERSTSQDHISNKFKKFAAYSSSPQLFKQNTDEQSPPPIPPLPMNYQRSDDESYATETRDQKKQRAISKATRQAELKRLRIAQEIQREQEEIEVQLKDLEARGVLIEKTIRGEIANDVGITNLVDPHLACDEKLLHELFEIYGSITQLKKRDEELSIRQQELQLEHRHAQLKEELNTRLSYSKLDKSSSDVAAEGAILNEMLEIVAKRAALRPSLTASNTNLSPSASPNTANNNDRPLNENESEI